MHPSQDDGHLSGGAERSGDLRLTRRDFSKLALGGLAGSIAAGALATTGAAPTAGASTAAARKSLQSVTLQTSWVPNPEFGSLYVAEKKGYWTKNGLQVTLLPGGPNVALSAVVASGKALVAMDSVTAVAEANLSAHSQKFRIIGAEFQISPYAVVSLASKPLRKPADLKGTKIGVAAGDVTSFKAFLKLTHVPESSVTIVPISFTTTPLTSGQVDGLVVFFTTQSVSLQVAGHKTVTMIWADFDFNQYQHCYFTLTSSLQDKRQELVELMAGIVEGAEFYSKNPEGTISLVQSFYKSSGVITAKGADLAARKYAEIMVSHTTDVHGLLWMGEAHQNIETMAAAGITGVPTSIFTNKILEAAYKLLK